jgi:hypothetical protein
VLRLVPLFDLTVHIVLDDFGKAGRVYRETDEQGASLDSVVDDLLTGQFNNPLRVVAFNTSEAWSRDMSARLRRHRIEAAWLAVPLRSDSALDQGQKSAVASG